MAGRNKERSINPVLAMRKSQRKRELKKTKQNRIQQRTTMLKQKDVSELIFEMENLDKLEVESIKKGYFNENTLREKKHKIRQTITQMISLYEKEDKDKAKEIKALLTNYDLRKNANTASMENLDSVSPNEDNNTVTTKEEIKKLLPNIPLPLSSIPFPSINPTKHNESDSVTVSEGKTSSTIMGLPVVAWLPSHLKPAPPPPSLPPSDAPALPDYLKNAVYHGPVLKTFFQPPSIIPVTTNTSATKITIAAAQPLKLVEEIDTNVNYTPESTLCAKPVLKDLQAEVVKLIPTTLQMKRNKPSTSSNITNNPQKKEKILESFMREINDIS